MERNEFRKDLTNTLQEHQQGWIVDGRYDTVADILEAESTDVICKSPTKSAFPLPHGKLFLSLKESQLLERGSIHRFGSISLV
jgi:hypothetical protein